MVVVIQTPGIVLEAYCPLGNPGSRFRGRQDPNILEDHVIKEVAIKHKITVGQVTLHVARQSNICHNIRKLL